MVTLSEAKFSVVHFRIGLWHSPPVECLTIIAVVLPTWTLCDSKSTILRFDSGSNSSTGVSGTVVVLVVVIVVRDGCG